MHICGVEKFNVLNDEVITWGYTPRVIGVIDAELSELWGYKVIPQGRWSYRNYWVITPGLSELLTRSLAGLFFCLLHGFWDLISICSCPELCKGQLQIPCSVRSTDATAKGVVSPMGSTTRLVALASEWIPDRKSASRCVVTTLHLGRDD